MKGRKWIQFGLIILCMVWLTACEDPLISLLGEKEDTDLSMIVNNQEPELGQGEGLRQTVLYYQDQEGIIIPVTKSIPWEEGIGKAAIVQLIDEPILRESLAATGLTPTFPAGTEILGMSIQDGLCKVDFNESILGLYSEAEEQAMVQSLVYTLTEFEAIDQVQLLVEGEIISTLSFGTQVDLPLEREAINLSAVLSEEMVPVTVYYKSTANGIDSYFVPVTKGVHSLTADIKSALVALLEGAPEGSNLYSEIPEGVSVEDVYVKDGVAYISLSEEIKKIPDNKTLQQSMVYEMGFTLKEIEPTISQVRILSGGQEIQLSSEVQLNLPDYSNVK